MRVNGYIRAQEVRVIAPDGTQIGVKKLSEALWLADQLELDLVEVAPEARPPVCRLMDYGKFKYEQSVRDREARKKQTKTVIKEARLTPRIAEHDFQLQVRKTTMWLAEGDKVKVTLRFRGRERERPEFGERVLNKLVEAIGDYAIVEQAPSLDGRNMVMTLIPSRKRPPRIAEDDADFAPSEGLKDEALAQDAVGDVSVTEEEISSSGEEE